MRPGRLGRSTPGQPVDARLAGDTASPLPNAGRKLRILRRPELGGRGYTRPHVRADSRARAGAPGARRGPASWRRRRPPRRTPPCSPRPTSSSSAPARSSRPTGSTSTPPKPRGWSPARSTACASPTPGSPAWPTGSAPSPRCPDPIGEVLDGWRRPNGLRIEQLRVPLGVVAIIYENRPNVTSDAAGICLKSGNAAILRGIGDRPAFEPGDRRGAARRPHQGRAPGRRGAARRRRPPRGRGRAHAAHRRGRLPDPAGWRRR